MFQWFHVPPDGVTLDFGRTRGYNFEGHVSLQAVHLFGCLNLSFSLGLQVLTLLIELLSNLRKKSFRALCGFESPFRSILWSRHPDVLKSGRREGSGADLLALKVRREGWSYQAPWRRIDLKLASS
jgi:hypothetical protein